MDKHRVKLCALDEIFHSKCVRHHSFLHSANIFPLDHPLVNETVRQKAPDAYRGCIPTSTSGYIRYVFSPSSFTEGLLLLTGIG